MHKHYFPGLNALRFYAALSVVVYHTLSGDFAELHRQPVTLGWVQQWFLHGFDAVILFFVLSGFLIMSLMLEERERTGTIAVGYYYARRALRILPLYFGLMIVGCIIFPLWLGPTLTHPFLSGRGWLFVVALLPNFAGLPLMVAHLWSLGVEEQFYLLFPLVAKARRFLVPILAGVIVLKMGVAALALVYPSNATLTMMNVWLPYECIALGALGAYAYRFHRRYLVTLYRRRVQLLLWLTFGVIVFVDTDYSWSFRNLALAVLFLGILLNVATNPRPLIRLNQPLWEGLGNLSYGMYIWHVPVLYVVLLALWALNWQDGYWEAVLLGTLGGTLGVAWASRRWLEAPFLRLKSHFQARAYSSVSNATCTMPAIVSSTSPTSARVAAVAPIHSDFPVT